MKKFIEFANGTKIDLTDAAEHSAIGQSMELIRPLPVIRLATRGDHKEWIDPPIIKDDSIYGASYSELLKKALNK